MTALHRHHHGDTIVEVMIVLAILGMALGISYATASASLNATQQAQEATQATSLLQSQIEDLRSLSAVQDPDQSHDIYNTSDFCMSGGSQPTVEMTTASCVHGIYTIAIAYDKTTDIFSAKATWNDLGGPDLDTATLFYRVPSND
jgi:type II secretory pathway pseudopilin PulG